MTLFRPHRGSLADAMAEVMIVDGLDDFIQQYRTRYPYFGSPHGKVNARYYFGEDPRIGWGETWIITDDSGVLGFTNGPLEPQPTKLRVEVV